MPRPVLVNDRTPVRERDEGVVTMSAMELSAVELPAVELPAVAKPAVAKPRGGRGPSRGVRLTRRGRLVVVVFLLLLTTVGLVLVATAGEAAPPAGSAKTVVVHPGDTLWSIAGTYLPSRD